MSWGGALSIDTRRFSVRADGTGALHVRDRDAPYHLHSVPAVSFPPVSTLAKMSEAQFDQAVADSIYT